ncbi:MAG: hypothetical protein GWO20_07495 [Candidatus Korarchaeota archaeon]|nr:hypothetical protein [Candidatus Korarchaeota archaeon]NIW14225.1 hypothetical protein [Candidatus Thorarchaeota archaeon]NIW51537.1 hypothetical protein [Candidatus Korarchaeota archaeon]
MAIPPRIAGYSSVAVTLVILFLLGAYLGKISKRSILINGLQMVAAAVLMTILLILTGG